MNPKYHEAWVRDNTPAKKRENIQQNRHGPKSDNMGEGPQNMDDRSPEMGVPQNIRSHHTREAPNIWEEAQKNIYNICHRTILDECCRVIWEECCRVKWEKRHILT